MAWLPDFSRFPGGTKPKFSNVGYIVFAIICVGVGILISIATGDSSWIQRFSSVMALTAALGWISKNTRTRNMREVVDRIITVASIDLELMQLSDRDAVSFNNLPEFTPDLDTDLLAVMRLVLKIDKDAALSNEKIVKACQQLSSSETARETANKYFREQRHKNLEGYIALIGALFVAFGDKLLDLALMIPVG